jgi:hypothetical protein
MVLMAITREKSTGGGGCYSGDRFQKRRERDKIVGGGRWHAGSTCRCREERSVGTGSGRGVAGPWARSGRGLEWFPGPSFRIFLFFLFSFSVFYFFHRFCINAPNQFKPLSEIL